MKNFALSYTIKYFFYAVLTALAVFLIGLAFSLAIMRDTKASEVMAESSSVCYVIDAGHGGEDAGAVAEDGTLEKDLNLSLAKALYALLTLNGNKAVMTRETDTLLYDYYDDLEDYSGVKKLYDLKNRLKIAENAPSSVYVGIHMNKFSVPKYSGLQVYYSTECDESRFLAERIRETVKSSVQPTNERTTKPADNSIYILSNISVPAVLIECGFLSNEAELTNLKSEEYRASLALCVFSALLD